MVSKYCYNDPSSLFFFRCFPFLNVQPLVLLLSQMARSLVLQFELYSCLFRLFVLVSRKKSHLFDSVFQLDETKPNSKYVHLVLPYECKLKLSHWKMFHVCFKWKAFFHSFVRKLMLPLVIIPTAVICDLPFSVVLYRLAHNEIIPCKSFILSLACTAPMKYGRNWKCIGKCTTATAEWLW